MTKAQMSTSAKVALTIIGFVAAIVVAMFVIAAVMSAFSPRL